MRCTECSQTLLPIVVFDVDGTLAEYHDNLGEFCWRYWGRNDPGGPAFLRGRWDGVGDFETHLNLSQEQYREAKLAWRQGGGKRMMAPIDDGMFLYRHVMGVDEEATYSAGRTVYKSTTLKVELWIATHRPYRRLDNVDPDTRFWLDRFSIKYDHLLFSEDKYQDLVNQVDADRVIAVFEDLPEYIDQGIEMGLPMAQVARPHNSGSGQSRPQRGSLDQLTYWYDDQVRQWQKRQETA